MDVFSQNHFKSFAKNYDIQYSEKYGTYRITRIKETVERIIDVKAGIFHRQEQLEVNNEQIEGLFAALKTEKTE